MQILENGMYFTALVSAKKSTHLQPTLKKLLDFRISCKLRLKDNEWHVFVWNGQLDKANQILEEVRI
jgi:hypothetical protein